MQKNSATILQGKGLWPLMYIDHLQGQRTGSTQVDSISQEDVCSWPELPISWWVLLWCWISSFLEAIWTTVNVAHKLSKHASSETIHWWWFACSKCPPGQKGYLVYFSKGSCKKRYSGTHELQRDRFAEQTVDVDFTKTGLWTKIWMPLPTYCLSARLLVLESTRWRIRIEKDQTSNR